MDFNKFNRILRQASLLPVIALLLAAGAIYLQMREANRTVTLIQQSDDRIDEANIIAKLTVDEEAGSTRVPDDRRQRIPGPVP